MQKDWITIGTAACSGLSKGGNDATSRVPALGESSGCGLDRRLEFVVEVAGPSLLDHQTHNRKPPSESEWAPQPRSHNRNPLDELERAPTRCVTATSR
jgi:hypothetical protein